MQILDAIIQNKLHHLCFEGHFGLEKENLRVNAQGELASTPHSSAFAARDNHPYITTDFAEAQLELITPICSSTKQARDFIIMLHHLVSLELQDEFLWPYSQPPKLPQDLSSIQIAQFNNQNAVGYREYLSQKYGKYQQLLCGVHFNFSFTDVFLQHLFQTLHPKQSYQAFCNQIYLKCARFYLKHAWIISYVFGAGHIMHQTYAYNPSQLPLTALGEDAWHIAGASSCRNGSNGYINRPKINVSFDHLQGYIQDLNTAIAQNTLIHAREYYANVRLKSKEKRQELADLEQYGIHYLEIRSLDLDPSQDEGVAQDTLDFLHLLLILGLCQEEESFDPEEALRLQLQISDQDHAKLSNTLRTQALDLFHQLKTLHQRLEGPKDLTAMLQRVEKKIYHPRARLASQVTTAVKTQGYQNYFLSLAKRAQQKSHHLAYSLYGFEDLELSTQILLRETIKQGIDFQILDRQENFLELSRQHNSQLVKQATKTGLDSYTCILAMENKVVTKTLVARRGLVVPSGLDFHIPTQAQSSYTLFCQHDIVIKPKNTNFGTGISILKHPFTQAAFDRAIELAFYHDQSILIEHFFPGQEFRFLVIAQETVAVLKREPANVIGDGLHSIQELIGIKNQDPRRGLGYKKPLEQIQIDDIVHHYLHQQNLNLNAIPGLGQKIYLRENSNISTGGDSIDYSQKMPDVYKQLAIQAAASVEANICGVDMIIHNPTALEATNNYCILELNFNPAIQMHSYPYEGQAQNVAIKILQALKLI